MTAHAPALFETVDENIVRVFPRVVEGLGGDPVSFLRRVGLSPGDFLNGEANPSYRQAIELVALAARELPCDDFGMRMAQAQAGTIRSPLMRVIENARTLGEALRLVCAHSYAHSPAMAIWLDEARSEETIAYGLDILLGDLPDRSQAMEQILLIAYSSIREVTGTRIRARCITFRHERIAAIDVYRRFFGCEVKFGQPADAMVFAIGDLDSPIFRQSGADVEPVLAEIYMRFPVREFPVHAKVLGILMKRMGSQRCGIGDVAASMGCSTKKLSRMLCDEDTTFQKIKTRFRLEVARYYITGTDIDFTAVSERLGFSEQSALTHFCRKWFRASPSALRSQARDGR